MYEIMMGIGATVAFVGALVLLVVGWVVSISAMCVVFTGPAMLVERYNNRAYFLLYLFHFYCAGFWLKSLGLI